MNANLQSECGKHKHQHVPLKASWAQVCCCWHPGWGSEVRREGGQEEGLAGFRGVPGNGGHFISPCWYRPRAETGALPRPCGNLIILYSVTKWGPQGMYVCIIFKVPLCGGSGMSKERHSGLGWHTLLEKVIWKLHACARGLRNHWSLLRGTPKHFFPRSKSTRLLN